MGKKSDQTQTSSKNASQKKTQFKLRHRPQYRGTVLTVLVFVVMTILVYAVAPPELPMFFQKLIGFVHACVGGIMALTIVKETGATLQHHADHAHGHDTHDHTHKHAEAKSSAPAYPPTAAYPPRTLGAESAGGVAVQKAPAAAQKASASGSHSGEFAHLHQLHLASVKRRKVGMIVGACVSAMIFGLWFTPAAPIDVQHLDVDLAGQLNDAATESFLILVEPNFPIPIRPTIYRATTEAAKKMYSGGSSFRRGMMALAMEDFDQARTLLKMAKGETPADANKIDLMLGQVELFNGNFGEAVKQFETLEKKKSEPLVLAHLAMANMHDGKYAKSAAHAKKLYDQSKTASPEERARNINLFLSVRALLWQRPELAVLQKEANRLSPTHPSMQFAALKNNTAVLDLLANPPNYTTAKITLNGSLEMSNKLKQQSGSAPLDEVSDYATRQNLSIADRDLNDPGELLGNATQLISRLTGVREKHPIWVIANHTIGFAAVEAGDCTRADDSQLKVGVMLANWPKSDLYFLPQSMLVARTEVAHGRWNVAASKIDTVIKRLSELSRNHPAIASARLQRLLLALEVPNKNAEEYAKELQKLIDDATIAYQNAGLGNHPDCLSIRRCQAFVNLQRKQPQQALEQVQSVLDEVNQRGERKDSTEKLSLSYETASLLALKAWILNDLQKSNDALKTMSEAERIIRETIEDERGHPRIGEIVLENARLCSILNRHKESDQKLTEWEQAIQPGLPADHPWLMEACEMHAASLRKLKREKDAKVYDERIKTLKAKIR